jgi:hypothetical protein
VSRRTVGDAVAQTLLAAVLTGELSAGQVVDLARRISERASLAGVDLDDLLELRWLSSRL